MRAVMLLAAVVAPLAAQGARAELQKSVDAYLRPLVAQGLFDGAVLIARGGEILVEQGYGQTPGEQPQPITAATQFKLMSISKTLLSAAVLRLVQDRVLALQDPVGKYVPDWPAAWSTVTLHDLLDHTSGIPDLQQEWTAAEGRAGARGAPAWPAFARSVPPRPLESRPGSEHRYSNFNVELLGVLVETVRGVDYRAFLRGAVLEPLGLAATGFDDGSRRPGLAAGNSLGRDGKPIAMELDQSLLQAACGLYSTVGDLYRFDRALRGESFLAAASYERMVTPRQGDYACGWLRRPVHGRPCCRHSGGASGYTGDFLRFPDDDACVIVLSNLGFAPVVRIGEDLAALLLKKKRPQPRQLDAQALARCEGVFGSPATGFVVVQRCGEQLVEFRGQDPFRGRVLLPIGETAFAEDAGGDVRLEYDRGAKGVRRLVDGTATPFARVAAPLAKWQAAAGPLQSVPAIGGAVRLVAQADQLALQVEGWPPIAVLPVDERRAIAHYEPFTCTWLVREGDAFRLRIESTEFRLERRPP